MRDDGKVMSARRRWLRRSLLLVGGSGLASLLPAGVRDAAAAAVPSSWRESGGGFSNYGQPRDDRTSPIRWISAGDATPGDGVAWTPLHELAGAITPNGLHFERHHNGIPAIDAARWELLLHGRCERAMGFTLADLHRLPQTSRIGFIECGGNSNALWRPEPVQTAAGYLHGLVSCAEWTGVLLADLLARVGPRPDARWLIAEGLDAAGMTVSLPLERLPDGAMLALYQNGEALRSSQGFPARLFIPGWEGITQVKWLRRLELADRPAMSRFDTVSYTDLLADGSATRFTHQMGVKSVITSPSPGAVLDGQGARELRGIAWSGAGTITRVEVSLDGGGTWRDATLQAPALPQALTPFRLPWQWQGEPGVLQSRAHDAAGNVQPTRAALLAEKGGNAYYHYNAINSWALSASGSLSHVYA